MKPLKFEDILKPVIWGGNEICKFKDVNPKLEGIGESWEISQVEGNVSVVADGEYKGATLTEVMEKEGVSLLGKHVVERFGKDFPLLIKFIDARDFLSIQVHPDDTLAKERHNSFGKTEMWYVISAVEGAGLYSGFSQEITPEEYVERIENNTITDVLQFHEVKSGDVFFLPAGRVHAIGKGIFIAEIQQNSNITYRIYDYNRKDQNGNGRELHTELAKDAIDYKLYSDLKTEYTPCVNEGVKLAECQYFSTSVLDIDGEVTYKLADRDSFSIFICMGGNTTLTDNEGNVTEMKQGETILVPATTQEVKIEGNAKLLECFIP